MIMRLSNFVALISKRGLVLLLVD